jgi:hypothetical protein
VKGEYIPPPIASKLNRAAVRPRFPIGSGARQRRAAVERPDVSESSVNLGCVEGEVGIEF